MAEGEVDLGRWDQLCVAIRHGRGSRVLRLLRHWPCAFEFYIDVNDVLPNKRWVRRAARLHAYYARHDEVLGALATGRPLPAELEPAAANGNRYRRALLGGYAPDAPLGDDCETAIMHASRRLHVCALRALLSVYGGDARVRDAAGVDALGHAMRECEARIAQGRPLERARAIVQMLMPQCDPVRYAATCPRTLALLQAEPRRWLRAPLVVSSESGSSDSSLSASSDDSD